MSQEWINVHTHKPGAGINIVDPCLGKIVLPENGKVYFSMGIHPLYIDATAEEKLQEIGQAAATGKIVAIGECGLDRNSPVPMKVQQDLFERQAELAARYDLPLIIHGVRAIPELITVCKKCQSHCKWIMHGFNNRREILQDLLRHEFYISAGRYVMNEASHIYRLLPEIPPDRLFIETDNSDFAIEEIYTRVARRRDVRVEELRKIVGRNYRRLFQDKITIEERIDK